MAHIEEQMNRPYNSNDAGMEFRKPKMIRSFRIMECKNGWRVAIENDYGWDSIFTNIPDALAFLGIEMAKKEEEEK